MKKILLITVVISVLTTTGCIVPGGDGGWHGHSRHEYHSGVIVGPPVVVVHPPDLIIR